MNERVSPESLLPLSFAPQAPQVELPTLVQASHAEVRELPALNIPSQPVQAVELPSLAPAPQTKIEELKPITKTSSETTQVAVEKAEPVAAPEVSKVVRPSVLKPVVKISGRTMARTRAELAVKERYSALKLKERGKKVTALAIGGLALAKSGLVKTPNVISAVSRIKESVINAPYKYVPMVKNRFRDLNESLYEQKGVLAKAIGFVAVAGIAYASYKNIDFTNPTQIVEAGDAANLGDSSGTTIDAQEQITSPGKPFETAVALDQTHGTTFEDVFVVEGGEGIVENIIDDFAQDGIKLDANEAYQIYQELDVKLDGNLITGDTYRMSNGDLGISQAGQFGWQQEMQNALEEIAKEKKKKKS